MGVRITVSVLGGFGKVAPCVLELQCQCLMDL